MRILLLSDDMNIGGVPKHIADLSHGLAERGHYVVVAASPGPFTNRLPATAPFVPVPILLAGSSQKNIRGILPTLRTLHRTIRDHRIDIVHSHKRYSDALARIVSKTAGIIHVSTCHNTFSDYRGITRFGTVTIACCENVRKTLIHHFHKPAAAVRTVYVGIVPLPKISPTKVASFRKSLGLPTRAVVFASVGSLTPAKDRITLVKSVALAKDTLRAHKGVCLVVGEGPDRAMLQQFIANNGLSDIITILPVTTDVAAVANLAEFFVLSSVQEGLPYVLLEAASLHKTHIATDVGGVSEFVVDGKSGILVPPRSPERLAGAIQFLIENPRNRKVLGANAKKKSDLQHDFRHFIDKTVEVYEMSLRAT